MRHEAPKAMPDLSTASDAELLDGSCGVFASNWIDSDQEPQATGNYLVVVRSYEPVIALYMKELGWDLSNTMHIGLEGKITHWMVLPEGPRRER